MPSPPLGGLGVTCNETNSPFGYLVQMKWFYALLITSISLQVHAQSPKLIRTKGKLPQLAYSTGEDRLGSAKMGYIDTSIVLPVLDSVKTLYRVRLSKNRSAYIDTSGAEPAPDTTRFRTTPLLAESWSVIGVDSNDVDLVTIILNGRPAYKSWMEINPARIKIELYNVQCNTNWITQLKSAKVVKDVWYEQVEDDVLQITLDLHYKQHYGYTIGLFERGLRLQIKRKPSKDIKNLVVVIDAGHGGTNTGATGVTGILEKDYTILFARELEKILKKQKVKVYMTREMDTLIDNKDRILWALQYKPDLFISFHLNSSGRATAKGVSTYYKHIGFRHFTQLLLNRLLTIKNLDEFGNIGAFNFQPSQPTDFINCLVEVAFLSNAEDEKMIRSEKFRKSVANQVYLGIRDWLKTVD